MNEQTNFTTVGNKPHTPIYIWIILVILLFSVAGSGTLYFLQSMSTKETTKSMQTQIASLKNDVVKLEQEKVELNTSLQQAEKTVQDNLDITNSHKSLVGYYELLSSSTTPIVKDFVEKTPEEIGLKEVATIKTSCPPNPDGPCGFGLIILSKNVIQSGNQEFYLATPGGAGYTYYGPFTDDLQRLTHETTLINSLQENY